MHAALYESDSRILAAFSIAIDGLEREFGGVMPEDAVSPDSLSALAEAAIAIRPMAHAPYSNFFVGAAVLDEKGEIHTGVNVENAAYPNGICAETAAIAAMVASGARRIRAIAVVGGGEGLCTPCGGCRQRIREFSIAETPIAIAGPGGIRKLLTLGELLPESFGPENLS
ncbi:cytidine deaminase [Roseibacillus persicicus]